MKRLLAIALAVAACGGATASVAQHPVEAPTPTTTQRPPTPSTALPAGVITFGAAFDPATGRIAKPLTRFETDVAEIAWSAALSRRVGATTMTHVFARQTASGIEQVITNVEAPISDPTADLVANTADLASFADHEAGAYVMRYIESGDVLAEGTFTLVGPDSTPAPSPTPTPTPTPTPITYATLTSRPWAQIVKAPDNYIGQYYRVWACITQFDAATGADTFRAFASYRNETYWFPDGENTLFTGDADQLAEYVKGDVLLMDVVVIGSFKYDTQAGGSATVPFFRVDAIQQSQAGAC